MSTQSEILTENNHSIEVSSVSDVPGQFELPSGKNRLVIGATKETEGENPSAGLEVVSMADYVDDEGFIHYKGIYFGNKGDQNEIAALIIDPLVPFNAENRTGFKALRKGEVVPANTLAKRFGKEAGFNIGLDENGKVMIESAIAGAAVDVLEIAPVEQAEEVADTNGEEAAEGELVSTEALEASAELHEEAAEDLGGLATGQTVEVETAPVDVEPVLEASESEEKDIPAEIKTSLLTNVTNFEESAKKYDVGIGTFNTLSEDAVTLRHFIDGMRDSYSASSFQTAMKQLNEHLQGKYHTARKHIEQSTSEMGEAVDSMTRGLEKVGLLQDANTKLEGLSSVLIPDKLEPANGKLRELHSLSDHLTQAIQSSYQRGFDEEELRGIASQLDSLSTNNYEHTVSKKLEQSIDDIRKAIGTPS